MKVGCAFVFVLMASSVWAQDKPKPVEQPPKEISELQKLKGENLKLRLQLEQLKVQVSSCTAQAMNPEAVALERDFLTTTVGSDIKGWSWDWQTMKPVKTPTPPTTP